MPPRFRFVTMSVVLALCAFVVACSSSTGRIAATATAGPVTTPSTTTPTTTPAPLVPAHGAYLGLYYGSGTVAATDTIVGTTPKIDLSYFNWTGDWADAVSTRQDFASGRIPLVNWKPYDVDFHDIVSGRYDAMLAARADASTQLPGRFFLDFAPEMNADEAWGGHDPGLYVAAFRHIHDLFARHGATGVVWVWAPNNTDSPGAPPALDYYPGSDYVDWTGMDGYNWGSSTADHVWQPFGQVFGPLYGQLHRLGKPIIVGETAADEYGGDKAQWIADILPRLQTDFPEIRAVVWFDVDKERHWQITSSPGAVAAFRTLAADPYFRPS